MMNERQELQLAMQQLPAQVGGRLCLDFVNTVEPRGGLSHLGEHRLAAQRDYLTEYSDFLAWSVLAHIVTTEEAARMQEVAQKQGQQANETMKKVIALRELLYGIFWRMAQDLKADEQELLYLQQAYLETLSHARLKKTEGHFSWQWTSESIELASPIWPVVQSAMELLTEGDGRRIKVCPGVPGDAIACAWLFYDESKNRTRHWCSMQDCGSGTKARRLTERRRANRRRQST